MLPQLLQALLASLWLGPAKIYYIIEHDFGSQKGPPDLQRHTDIQFLVKDRDLKKVPDEGRLLLVKDRDGLAL